MSEAKTRVVLVEDNAGDVRLLTELLREVPRRPFELVSVDTLAAALPLVSSHDVVLLDLSLPDAHGAETVTRIRRAAPRVPIVVLTGNTDDDLVHQVVAEGADDYLLKSEITPSLIARTILYAVERRRNVENAAHLYALEVASAQSRRFAERARFLADVSAALSTCLTQDEVAQAVCDAVVPRLADVCIVDAQARRAGNEGLVRLRVGARETGPDVERLASFAPRGPTSPVVRAVTSRRVVDVPDVVATLDDIAVDPAHRQAVQASGARCAVVLPMLARDRAVGAITCVSCAPGPYDEERRELAEEVARRAAAALDNAILHHETQRALRAREEVLAIVSHDLRNPLSVFALALQTTKHALEAGARPPVDALVRGARAVARMERLIGDLLDVARIDAGTFTVQKTSVDLAALLREAVEQNTALAAQKALRLHVDAPPVRSVAADRDRLTQVVANLLGNAIKFTPREGQVRVECRDLPDGVEVSVVDTGPGVASRDQHQVFDRFYQSDARRGGVGLGLTIAKGIVDAHGGRIGVERAAGGGARFWFALPNDAESEAAA